MNQRPTQEQLAMAETWMEKWKENNKNTTPTTLEEVRPLVLELYRAAKRSPPLVIELVPNAVTAIYVGIALDHIYHNVKLNLLDTYRPREEVAEAFRMFSHDLDKVIRQQAMYYRGGMHWSPWFSHVTFHRDVLNWEHDEMPILNAEEALAKKVGWYWAGTYFCILSQPPQEIHFDDQFRLHNENGPALMWADGTKTWWINGLVVDEQIVMNPHTQTIDQIRQEENEEIRRIRIERYGWEAYLTNINAKVLDQRENEIEQTVEVLMEGDNMRVLVVHCPSTGRIYGLEVLGEIKTCAEAQAWLWGESGIRIIDRA